MSRITRLLLTTLICVLTVGCAKSSLRQVPLDLADFDTTETINLELTILPIKDTRATPLVVGGVRANQFDREIRQIKTNAKDPLPEDYLRDRILADAERFGCQATSSDNENIKQDPDIPGYIIDSSLQVVQFRNDCDVIWIFEAIIQVDVYHEGKKAFSFMVVGTGKEFGSGGGSPGRYRTDKAALKYKPKDIAYTAALQDAARRIIVRTHREALMRAGR